MKAMPSALILFDNFERVVFHVLSLFLWRMASYFKLDKTDSEKIKLDLVGASSA